MTDWYEPTFEELMYAEQREELLQRARAGELDPNGAEAEASRLLLGKLAWQPLAADFDPRNKSRWSLQMVLAWIVWRNFDEVRLWDAEYRVRCRDWKSFSVPSATNPGSRGFKLLQGWTVEARSAANAITFECWGYAPLAEGNTALVDQDEPRRAKVKLWEALLDGKLVGEGLPATGGARQLVPALEWQDLENGTGGPDDRDYFYYRHEAAGRAYEDITWRRDQVTATWPVLEKLASIGAESQIVRRAARPSDEADLKSWVVARVNGGGMTPTRKELELWAKRRGIGVEWARQQHKDFPADLKLNRGETPAQRLAKRQRTDRD